MKNEQNGVNSLEGVPDGDTNQDIVKYEKKYPGRLENRSVKEGRLEANKRREFLPVIDMKIKLLLKELNIHKFITYTTGSVGANMCNQYSDIDLELLVPEDSQLIDTNEFTMRLNKELSIPYSVHIFPIYVEQSYFQY